MKRYRPHTPGFIVLYVLMLLSLADVVYTTIRQVKGINNDLMGGFSFFSYLVFAMACCYVWQYARAQVVIDGTKMRVAFPANIRPRQGQPRAMIIFRQGDLDLKFIDKTFDLKLVTRYGYVEDLGYDRLDQSQGGDKSKLFPVHEVAFITSENKRYHMNAGIYNAQQNREIFTQVRDISGVEPEGKLAEVLK
jgi:hypothetical protein